MSIRARSDQRFPPVRNNAIRLALEDGRTRSFVEARDGASARSRHLVLALRQRPGDLRKPDRRRIHRRVHASARRAARARANRRLCRRGIGRRVHAAGDCARIALRRCDRDAVARARARRACSIARGEIRYALRREIGRRDRCAGDGVQPDGGRSRRPNARAREHQHELENRVAQRTSEWRQAADAQRESAAELRLITENMPVGLCYIDRSICAIASTTVSTFAWSACLTRTSTVTFDRRCTRHRNRSTQWKARSGRRSRDIAIGAGAPPRRPRRQAARPARRAGTANLADDGAVAGFYAMAQDISEHKRAEQALLRHNDELTSMNRQLQQAQNQLLQSEKMASIGQLAAGVAHEINNPIGYVQSNFGTLERYLDRIFDVLACYEDAEPAIGDPALRAKIDAAKRAATSISSGTTCARCWRIEGRHRACSEDRQRSQGLLAFDQRRILGAGRCACRDRLDAQHRLERDQVQGRRAEAVRRICPRSSAGRRSSTRCS